MTKYLTLILNFLAQYGIFFFRIEMICIIFWNLFIEFVYNRWKNSDYERSVTLKCFVTIILSVLLFILSFFVPELILLRTALILWFFRIIWNIFTGYVFIEDSILPIIICISVFILTFY